MGLRLFRALEGILQNLQDAFGVFAAHADPGNAGWSRARAAILHEVHNHTVIVDEDINDIRE